MTEQEINNMVNNFILNREGLIALDSQDIETIRNAGSLLDGERATCETASLLDTLRDVYISIVTAHPKKKVTALLVQLDANTTSPVQTSIQSFFNSFDDIEKVWSVACSSSTNNIVNVYMLVAMDSK